MRCSANDRNDKECRDSECQRPAGFKGVLSLASLGCSWDGKNDPAPCFTIRFWGKRTQGARQYAPVPGRESPINRKCELVMKKRILAGALVWSTMGSVALHPYATRAADNYPSKPVRMIVPFAPGGGTDIIARQLGQELSKRFGQSVVIENRGGAGGMVGMETAARAAPDGYTLLLGQVGQLAINPALYPKIAYDPVKDYEPIILVASQPLILVVNPAVPAKSIAELIALAKDKPGTLNFSSAGNGSLSHLAGGLFKSITGAPIVHVPYKGGGPAITDLIAGQVQLTFNVIPGVLPHLKAGRLRGLAVSYASSALPTMSTMHESGVPGYELGSWFGMLAPVGMPADLIKRLNSEILATLRSPEIRQLFDEQGVNAIGSAPDAFARHIKSELLLWAKAVKSSGAQVD